MTLNGQQNIFSCFNYLRLRNGCLKFSVALLLPVPPTQEWQRRSRHEEPNSEIADAILSLKSSGMYFHANLIRCQKSKPSSSIVTLYYFVLSSGEAFASETRGVLDRKEAYR